MTHNITKGVAAAIFAVALFIVSEVIGGLITAYLVRKHGFECPFAAKKQNQ